MLNITITDTDLGYKSLRKRLSVLGKSVVESGLFTPAEAQKGHWLEFGFEHHTAGKIEPRPWASVAGDTGAQAFGSAMGVAIGQVCDGERPHDALDPVGEMVADSMANVITTRQVGGPDNATSTQDLKGHGIKGLDSGDMIADITWQVTP